jgi:hypothetical protein
MGRQVLCPEIWVQTLSRRYFSYREIVSFDEKKRFATEMMLLFLIFLDLDSCQEIIDLLCGVDAINKLTIFVAQRGKLNCNTQMRLSVLDSVVQEERDEI